MSLRNNEERMGARPAEAPIAAAQEGAAKEQQGGAGTGLNFVTPTELINLPSAGKYYPPEHPLHGEETIEIKHMTAREEEILTSRSFLKKGVAIDKLLQSVIVNKSIKIGDLLVGDKNAILVYTRVLAYGAEYKTKITCPACGDVDDYEFNLLEHTVTTPDDMSADYKICEDGTFEIPLPKTQVVACVRLLTGEDEAHFARQSEARKKKQKKLGMAIADNALTEQMKSFIVSLNGVSDKREITGFVNNMPAIDSRHLRSVYARLTPNVDLTQNYECSSCDHEQEMEVPFTSDFFWPRQ